MHLTSKQSGVPYETVRRTIENYQKRGTTERQSGSGRPRKTTHSDDMYMALQIKRDRESTCTDLARDMWQNSISASTVRRRLHENSDLGSHRKGQEVERDRRGRAAVEVDVVATTAAQNTKQEQARRRGRRRGGSAPVAG